MKIKLTKANLIKKLGLTKEEADFYLEMMDLIPIGEDGMVEGRLLHKLIVLDDTSKTHKDGTLQKGSKFTEWIAKRIKKYGFELYQDYTTYYAIDGEDIAFHKKRTLKIEEVESMSSQKRSALGISNEYKLSINMAKELCMIENNETGRKFRNYFILNERIVHDKLAWEEERNENKKYCKEMKDYYKNTYIEANGKEPSPKEYAVLQNAVYIVAFDMVAKELKEKLDIKYNHVVPDWVQEEINKALDFVYQRFSYMIDEGELDIDTLIKRGAKVFDRRYDMPIELE